MATEEHGMVYGFPPVELSERQDAMGGYLMMFAALALSLPFPIINLIAAGIYYWWNRNKSSFVVFHNLQAFLSMLPTTLVNLALIYWTAGIIIFGTASVSTAFWIYVVFAATANILYLVFNIMAAVYAYKGEYFFFTVIGRISYRFTHEQ